MESAENNYDEAKFQLGKLRIFGEPHIKRNYKKAYNYFFETSESGIGN